MQKLHADRRMRKVNAFVECQITLFHLIGLPLTTLCERDDRPRALECWSSSSPRLLASDEKAGCQNSPLVPIGQTLEFSLSGTRNRTRSLPQLTGPDRRNSKPGARLFYSFSYNLPTSPKIHAVKRNFCSHTKG